MLLAPAVKLLLPDCCFDCNSIRRFSYNSIGCCCQTWHLTCWIWLADRLSLLRSGQWLWFRISLLAGNRNLVTSLLFCLSDRFEYRTRGATTVPADYGSFMWRWDRFEQDLAELVVNMHRKWLADEMKDTSSFSWAFSHTGWSLGALGRISWLYDFMLLPISLFYK